MKGLALNDIQSKLASNELDLIKLIEYYLAQIDLHKGLNIYVEVFREESLQKAKDLQEKFKNKEKLGRLFGAVISIKDVICYKDHPVTAGSKILSGFHSIYHSTAVKRLLEEDAIIIGVTNCDEFAMGSSNENSYYGPTRNMFDPERIPGGSSGGAAVSVQADTCLVALGSDTGGSVRQPAAFTGVLGIKPSYGRISRHGLIAYASSFDQIGILSKNNDDLALTLEVIAGHDDFDSTVSTLGVPPYSQRIDKNRRINVGYLPSFFDHEKMNPVIRERSQAFLRSVEKHYGTLKSFDFKELEYLVPAYYVLTTAEASSNLSRYDGIRYGYRSENISDLHSLYTSSRTEGFGLEVKRRIMLGTFVLSAGYYDAYFEQAQKIRKVIKEAFEEMLSEVDILLMPVSMDYPWKIGEMDKDPVSVYLSDVFTVIANICGKPAISIPIHHSEDQLSCGIQVLGNRFMEQDLFDFTANMETVA